MCPTPPDEQWISRPCVASAQLEMMHPQFQNRKRGNPRSGQSRNRTGDKWIFSPPYIGVFRLTNAGSRAQWYDHRLNPDRFEFPNRQTSGRMGDCGEPANHLAVDEVVERACRRIGGGVKKTFDDAPI
jgi:hypothetical protein